MKSIYAIYDRVSEQYMNPEAHLNDGVASRAFIMSCVNPSVPENYLKDISLVRCGCFDENSGVLIPENRRTIMFGDSTAIIDLRKQYMEVEKNEASDAEESD